MLGLNASKIDRDTDKLNQYEDELEVYVKPLIGRLRVELASTKVIIDEFVIDINEDTKNCTLEEMAMKVVLKKERVALENMLLEMYGRDILTRDEFRTVTKYGDERTDYVIKVYKVEEEMFSVELTAKIIIDENGRTEVC